MSYAVDAATKVHKRQIATATKVQQVLVNAVAGLSGLREKAPKVPSAPESITGPLEKVSAPVARVVGSPREFATYFADSRRDWVEVQEQFQKALVAATRKQAPASASAKVVKPKVVKS